MMTPDQIRLLFGYHYDSYQRVWAIVEGLSDEQFLHETDYSWGSLRNHLVHVISVDSRWIARVVGQSPPDRLTSADFPTQRAARVMWDEREAQNRAAIGTLDQGRLDAGIEFALPHRHPEPITRPSWQILAHVVNHGTDHRAQILHILYSLGAPTFEQDLIDYLWRSE